MRVAIRKLEKGETDVEAYFLAALVSLLMLYLFFPFKTDTIMTCPFKAITGIPCPTCGFTRSALMLATCDLSGAIKFSPLFTLTALCSVPYAILATLNVVFKVPRLRIKFERSIEKWLALVLLFVIIFASWIRSIIIGL
jgi:hypothetical protein